MTGLKFDPLKVVGNHLMTKMSPSWAGGLFNLPSVPCQACQAFVEVRGWHQTDRSRMKQQACLLRKSSVALRGVIYAR